MFLGLVRLGDNLTFYANTHTPATGAAVDADAVPGYRVYEDETAGPLLTGSMALLDDANTVGFYSEQIAVSAANGFEAGKSYCIRITAVVAGVTGVEVHQFDVQTRLTDDLSTYAGGAVASVTGAVGSVSGLTPGNLDAKVSDVKTKTDYLPSVTAGNAGGVSIVGSKMDLVDAPNATGAAALGLAFWHVLASAVTLANSIGLQIKTALDAAITSRLAPTVATRTLDVSDTGEAGLDFANIKAAANPTTLTNLTIPTVTTLTNAPSDSSGVTTLLTRLSDARAGYLDVLNGLVAAIWAAVTDSAGVTTLLSRLSAARAGYLDVLNGIVAAVQSGLATSANQTTIIAKTNLIPASPAQAGEAAAAVVGLALEANVQTHAAAALTAYDPPTKAEMDAALLVIRGADSDTLETLSDQIDNVTLVGAGAHYDYYLVTEDDGTTPIQSVGVWVSTDAAGSNVVAGTIYTASNGRAYFKLDEGATYYFWRRKDGWTFTDPDTEVW